MDDHDGWAVGHGPRACSSSGAATASSSATVARCRASSQCCSAAARRASARPSSRTPRPPARRREGLPRAGGEGARALRSRAGALAPRAGAAARDRGAPRHVVGGGDAVRLLVGAGPPARPPEESDLPRHVSIFEPDGADRFRVAEGRERGELLRVVRAGDGSIEKLYWATYPVTRAAAGVRLAPAGLVEDQRRADVGGDEHGAAPAARPALREQRGSEQRRAGHDRDLDLPERERRAAGSATRGG